MPLDRTSAYEVVAGNNFTNYIRTYIERALKFAKIVQKFREISHYIQKKNYKKVQFDTALFVRLVKG